MILSSSPRDCNQTIDYEFKADDYEFKAENCESLPRYSVGQHYVPDKFGRQMAEVEVHHRNGKDRFKGIPY